MLDAESGAPISQAVVRLLSLEGLVLREAISTESGRFQLLAAESGRYAIQAGRIGYLIARVGPVRIVADSTVELELRLSVNPVTLEPVEAEAEARVPYLERVGFYDRQRSGFGVFMDRAHIEVQAAILTTDLLHGIPGVVFVSGRLRFRGGMASGCGPSVFLDGIRVFGLDLNGPIGPNDLAGIEVYRSAAQAPLRYGGPDSACGVLLLWTRR